MGVIYKLKPDMIAFIVEQKKKDRTLSCRMLVNIIEQQFQKRISKSSVNAIFQQYHLSNNVGRSHIFKAPKNFFIPQEKKENLKAALSPYLNDVIQQGSTKENDEEYFDDAGEVFLRIGLWGLSQEPVLGVLLKSWAQVTDEKKISIYQWEDIAFKNSLRREKTKKNFFKMEHLEEIEKIFQNKKMTMAQEIQWDSLSQSLLMVAQKVKIISKEEKVFYIDALLKEIISKEEKGISRPLYRTIEDVVDCIINNIRPLYVGVQGVDEKDLNQLKAIFENEQEGIKKIEILNQQNDILSEYSFIPEQKRNIFFIEHKKESFLNKEKSDYKKAMPFDQRNEGIINTIRSFVRYVFRIKYIESEAVMEALVTSPGYIKQTKENLEIKFKEQIIDKEAKKQIETMMKTINEYCIFDREGRRILIDLI